MAYKNETTNDIRKRTGQCVYNAFGNPVINVDGTSEKPFSEDFHTYVRPNSINQESTQRIKDFDKYLPMLQEYIDRDDKLEYEVFADRVSRVYLVRGLYVEGYTFHHKGETIPNIRELMTYIKRNTSNNPSILQTLERKCRSLEISRDKTYAVIDGVAILYATEADFKKAERDIYGYAVAGFMESEKIMWVYKDMSRYIKSKSKSGSVFILDIYYEARISSVFSDNRKRDNQIKSCLYPVAYDSYNLALHYYKQ